MPHFNHIKSILRLFFFFLLHFIKTKTIKKCIKCAHSILIILDFLFSWTIVVSRINIWDLATITNNYVAIYPALTRIKRKNLSRGNGITAHILHLIAVVTQRNYFYAPIISWMLLTFSQFDVTLSLPNLFNRCL